MKSTSESEPATTAFREYEVKYLLEDHDDISAFFDYLRSLEGVLEKHVDVTDTYYRFAHLPERIYRHRHDHEIQQLTVKSYGGDTRDRLEINLALENTGSQQHAMEAFLKSFGDPIAFGINKKVDIFDFPDCEIVHYIAQADGKRVRCVEFEAVGVPNWDAAQAVIARYAGPTGFLDRRRCEISLFDLLSP